jgi:NADH dehydrogenase/putative oxidoreductase
MRAAARLLRDLGRLAQGAAAPWLALLVRLCLAQAFVVDGVMTMMHAPAAASGAALLPDIALLSVAPLLLTLGLLTRPAAALLIWPALTMKLAGATPDARLFWVALLGWLAVFGPGLFSLDRLLARGAESVAIPGASALVHAFAWVARRIEPLYQLGLRVWLAAAPAGLALMALDVTPAMQPGAMLPIPHVPAMVAALPPSVALSLAALLALGLLARLSALVLLTLVPLGAVALSGDVRLYWALLLALHVVHGAGPIAVDAPIWRRLLRAAVSAHEAALPHVVIVGGGFGGVAAARGLRGARCRVTLIDRRNHQVFQPLLYQVATASLAPGGIAAPIRSLFRDQANVRVVLGDVAGIDSADRTVILDRGRIGFDYLVLASGAQHSYFGRDDWAAFAPGLKSIEDGTAIRRRLLLAFEEAENETDPAARQAWLTFVIVGGGPTGVELAGAIAELARHGLAGEFRAIDPAAAKVILVQSGPRLLPAFPEALSHDAERALRRLGVDVQTDRRVEMVAADRVRVSGAEVAARTVLWAAGVMASPAASWLGVAPDRAGRVPVGPDLSVAGHDGIYAVGDTAAARAWRGDLAPGLAPAAKQGGGYVARVIRARLAGRPPPEPFRYRHFGSLATIGRQSAVADFGFLRLRGALAWWLWGIAHIAFLVGGRNRAVVMLEWFWAYLTFRRGTRLITGR